MFGAHRNNGDKARIKSPSILGRPLLAADPVSCSISFLSRTDMPPLSPVHFQAKEPFTVLGVNPQDASSDISVQAVRQADAWLAILPRTPKYERERGAVQNAMSMLGQQQSIIQYRAFARKYEVSRKPFSRNSIQRGLARAIVSQSPLLRSKQKIRTVQSGGIFAVAFLMSLVLLIVILTLPVGGVAIMGYVIFSTTLIAAWGPAAIIPVLALLALGGVSAYLFKRYKDVFQELQAHLGQVLDYMESMAYAFEDNFFLREFKTHQQAPDEFKMHKKQMCDERTRHMSAFIDMYIRSFIDRLSELAKKWEGRENVTVDRFFALLADHPGEVRECFLQTLSKSVIEKGTCRLQLEAENTKGE